MGRRLTQEEFIREANEVHGGVYDYSKVVYRNNCTKVEIICPIHGSFLQQPRTHLAGQGCPRCAHGKRAETCKERYGIERPFLSDESRERAKHAIQEKYGVDNVFKLDSVQEKAREIAARNRVNRVREPELEDFFLESERVHGNKYDYSRAVYVDEDTEVEIVCSVHGVFRQVPRKHRKGIGCPKCTKERTLEKQKDTFRKKYGVDNPMQDPSVRARAKATNLERYGVANSMQAKEVRERARQTMRERYGVDHPMQSPEIMGRIRQTLEERYGVENVRELDEVNERIARTNLERYGSANPFGSALVQEKIRDTNMERYGVAYPAQNAEIKAKQVDTLVANYGVDNPMKSKEIRGRMEDTCLVRYGVRHVLQNSEIRNKAYLTTVERFGTEHALRNEELLIKSFVTKSERGTFHASFPEDRLYGILCDRFGESDVKRQYLSDEYLFPCDFYIASRDLYIELNAFWSHGFHWYDVENEADKQVALEWQEKAKRSLYYRNILRTWTVQDVRKRETAKGNKLNYLTFWTNDLSDVEEWIAAGCPDGQDYLVEYSWRQAHK